MNVRPVDRPLLFIHILLITGGAIIFFSASLGLLGRESGGYLTVLFKQYGLGLLGGAAAMYGASRIKYQKLRKYAYIFFLGGLALSILVFVPGLGMSHGGASRWVDLGIISFQPSEFLKFGTIIYIAAILTASRKRVATDHMALLPILGVIGAAALILLRQPDMDTLGVIVASVIAMYIAATGKWHHALFVSLLGLLLLIAAAQSQPYMMERIKTLIHPTDFQGSGYQIKQSLIAVGSGGLFGRGFGQSVQKYDYLPEPIGDSIFAVYAEETGFIGSVILILLFIAFTMRGLTVAARSPDMFGGLLAVGIVILISAQSFINIAAMIGILPLSGIPLVFVSHGGTALLVAMAETGVLLGISRNSNV
jgi:cell division protein FtsW